MRENKLKPCPFCGKEMRIEPVRMIDNKTIRYEPFPKGYRHKRGCALEFAAYIGWPTTEKAAIKKWNRRENNGTL